MIHLLALCFAAGLAIGVIAGALAVIVIAVTTLERQGLPK